MMPYSLLLKITLPLQEPVLIFALVLVIILLAPTLIRKLNIPEIIGLILAGVLVGPHGLNLLSEELEFSIFGTTGLLYLMFLAGLEIDVKDFKKNKEKSIAFGLLTFVFPFGLSFLVSYYILDFSILASLLISSMMATHTLVAFPIISNLNISKNRVINISIGGTIIADTIALLILAVISESTSGTIDLMFWLKFVVYFSVFVFIVNYLFPKLSKWFFRNYDGQTSLEYIFVLTIVFVSAVIAELAHIEPIIGAFFAGLALNRLIPKSSPLMNRIVFIGHTLFIPFFLISVGMLVNFEVIFTGSGIIWVILILLLVGVVSKYLPAYLMQKFYRYTVSERNLIFGLTNARAASAIAIIIVGFNLGIVHETVMNATIILVLITSMLSSFVTERSGKKIALAQKREIEEIVREERILVPLSNPETIDKLMSFALMIKDEESEEPLFPITIVPDDEEAPEKVVNYSGLLEEAQEYAASADHSTRPVSRVDTNVADGIARAVKELMINKIVLGWHGKKSTVDFFFGTMLSNLLQKTGKAIYVAKMLSPISLVERIHVLMPPSAEFEVGFQDWVHDMFDIVSHTNSSIVFWGYTKTHNNIKEFVEKFGMNVDVTYRQAKCSQMLKVISRKLNKQDLLVVVKARKNTLSYNKDIKNIPDHLDTLFKENNIVVIYPEQEIKYDEALAVQI